MKIWESAVEGHEGKCFDVWLNQNQLDQRFDMGVTGFFRPLKKKFPYIGKVFHGIIKNDGKVHSTALPPIY